jgi:ubiquinone/menaquinone biosynthesis C-methylase UbiE
MRLPLHAPHGNRPKMFQGRRSRIYDVVARRLLRGFYRRVADDVAAYAPQGAAVLDVGTGPGVLLVELAGRRPDLQLTGLDLSADMVAAANRNLSPYATRASATVGDVTDPPFPDGSFDVIVSSLSLHHWDHPERAAPELARILRSGGQLRIYDFRWAPFDKLAASAAAASVFTARPPERTQIRTGIALHPRIVRYILSS